MPTLPDGHELKGGKSHHVGAIISRKSTEAGRMRADGLRKTKEEITIVGVKVVDERKSER
jgi:hypothetical protein